MIRHESARLLSSFTIFDIVLDRLRLGKMGTSSHFLSAFTIFCTKSAVARIASGEFGLLSDHKDTLDLRSKQEMR